LAISTGTAQFNPDKMTAQFLATVAVVPEPTHMFLIIMIYTGKLLIGCSDFASMIL
jgi:hypothetical protein